MKLIHLLPDRSQSALLFAACWLCVAFISVHDAILVVRHDVVISQFEQNPLGLWFLELQGGEVWLFVIAKLIGTATVCATLLTLYYYRQRIAVVAGSALAAFQLALLSYLTFA